MKKALIIIDIQNDYLYDKRLKKFNYDTNTVINNINNTINKYKEEQKLFFFDPFKSFLRWFKFACLVIYRLKIIN